MKKVPMLSREFAEACLEYSKNIQRLLNGDISSDKVSCSSALMIVLRVLEDYLPKAESRSEEYMLLGTVWLNMAAPQLTSGGDWKSLIRTDKFFQKITKEVDIMLKVTAHIAKGLWPVTNNVDNETDTKTLKKIADFCAYLHELISVRI